MQMRTHDEDGSVYRRVFWEIQNEKRCQSRIICKSIACVVASDNFEFELQSSVSNEQNREDRRFFKRGMKFSMEAN